MVIILIVTLQQAGLTHLNKRTAEQHHIKRRVTAIADDVQVKEIEAQSDDALAPVASPSLKVISNCPADGVRPSDEHRYDYQRAILGDFELYKQAGIIDDAEIAGDNYGTDDKSSLFR